MTLEEMKKIVLNDSETKHLNLENDFDIDTCYQYITLRDSNSLPGYKVVLKTEPYFFIEYQPTKEKLVEDAAKKLKSQLGTFASDIYIQDASLSDFSNTDEYRSKAVKHALNFLEVFPNKYAKGFYVYGPYRTGKSFLLSAIATNLINQQKVVVLAFVPDLIRTLKTDMAEGNLEKRINALKRADCLMLDDLGGEHMSEWFRDEILLPVLQYRLMASLPVFISSNLSLQELAENLSRGRQQDDFMKAARITQRIRDLTLPIELKNRYESSPKDL